MAIAGLVLSGIWALVWIVVLIAVAVNAAGRDSTGVITAPGDVPATALRVGDCLNGVADGTFTSLPAVPCTSAHEGEVFAIFNLPAGPYPGETEVNNQAEDKCSARVGVYAPSFADLSVGLFLATPNATGWRAGDLEEVCIAKAIRGTTTGSIRGRSGGGGGVRDRGVDGPVRRAWFLARTEGCDEEAVQGGEPVSGRVRGVGRGDAPAE